MDTVTKNYIYPPNWEEGNYDDGSKGHANYFVHLTNISDGTGETNVKKVDLSNFLTTDGQAASRFSIKSIECLKYGFSSITLKFDRAPHVTIAVMGDSGSYPGIVDDSDGGTGDILLNVAGVVGGTYDITIWFKIK